MSRQSPTFVPSRFFSDVHPLIRRNVLFSRVDLKKNDAILKLNVQAYGKSFKTLVSLVEETEEFTSGRFFKLDAKNEASGEIETFYVYVDDTFTQEEAKRKKREPEPGFMAVNCDETTICEKSRHFENNAEVVFYLKEKTPFFYLRATKSIQIRDVKGFRSKLATIFVSGLEFIQYYSREGVHEEEPEGPEDKNDKKKKRKQAAKESKNFPLFLKALVAWMIKENYESIDVKLFTPKEKPKHENKVAKEKYEQYMKVVNSINKYASSEHGETYDFKPALIHVFAKKIKPLTRKSDDSLIVSFQNRKYRVRFENGKIMYELVDESKQEQKAEPFFDLGDYYRNGDFYIHKGFYYTTNQDGFFWFARIPEMQSLDLNSKSLIPYRETHKDEKNMQPFYYFREDTQRNSWSSDYDKYVLDKPLPKCVAIGDVSEDEYHICYTADSFYDPQTRVWNRVIKIKKGVKRVQTGKKPLEEKKLDLKDFYKYHNLYIHKGFYYDLLSSSIKKIPEDKQFNLVEGYLEDSQPTTEPVENFYAFKEDAVGKQSSWLSSIDKRFINQKMPTCVGLDQNYNCLTLDSAYDPTEGWSNVSSEPKLAERKTKSAKQRKEPKKKKKQERKEKEKEEGKSILDLKHVLTSKTKPQSNRSAVPNPVPLPGALLPQDYTRQVPNLAQNSQPLGPSIVLPRIPDQVLASDIDGPPAEPRINLQDYYRDSQYYVHVGFYLDNGSNRFVEIPYGNSYDLEKKTLVEEDLLVHPSNSDRYKVHIPSISLPGCIALKENVDGTYLCLSSVSDRGQNGWSNSFVLNKDQVYNDDRLLSLLSS